MTRFQKTTGLVVASLAIWSIISFPVMPLYDIEEELDAFDEMIWRKDILENEK